jgi:hypothetical protein
LITIFTKIDELLDSRSEKSFSFAGMRDGRMLTLSGSTSNGLDFTFAISAGPSTDIGVSALWNIQEPGTSRRKQALKKFLV